MSKLPVTFFPFGIHSKPIPRHPSEPLPEPLPRHPPLMGVDLRACRNYQLLYSPLVSTQNQFPDIPQNPHITPHVSHNHFHISHHMHMISHTHHTTSHTHLTQTSLLMGVDLRACTNYRLGYSPMVSTQNHSPSIPHNHSPDIPPNGGGSKSLYKLPA